MAVKIRLKRFGKMRAPYYRIVVMDSRAKRDGRAIEEIGKYHPKEAFTAPEKGSVIVPEAITPKSKKADEPEAAEAE